MSGSRPTTAGVNLRQGTLLCLCLHASLRQSISSVGSKLFSRTHHTENQKLLHTFTTPNALLSLILKMLGRMPTYCMPVAYPLPACHPPTPPATNRMLYHIYTVIYL